MLLGKVFFSSEFDKRVYSLVQTKDFAYYKFGCLGSIYKFCCKVSRAAKIIRNDRMRSEGHQFDRQCFNWGKACMALRLEMWCVTPTKSYRSTVNSFYETIDRPFLVEGVFNGWSLRSNFAWRSDTTARNITDLT